MGAKLNEDQLRAGKGDAVAHVDEGAGGQVRVGRAFDACGADALLGVRGRHVNGVLGIQGRGVYANEPQVKALGRPALCGRGVGDRQIDLLAKLHVGAFARANIAPGLQGGRSGEGDLHEEAPLGKEVLELVYTIISGPLYKAYILSANCIYVH